MTDKQIKPDIRKQLRENYEQLQSKILYLENKKIKNSDPSRGFQLDEEIKELNVKLYEVETQIKNFDTLTEIGFTSNAQYLALILSS
ncbi:hypothetical protein RIVM261_069110 [Rivularia sp. IAM M-261]|nr:hypothetical protein RIVM261_069110 [Rivularia sp. IAM M-261]